MFLWRAACPARAVLGGDVLGVTAKVLPPEGQFELERGMRNPKIV